MAQHLSHPTDSAGRRSPDPTPPCNWRWLMEDPPTDELFGWAVLMLLAFAPPIGWLLASFLREAF